VGVSLPAFFLLSLRAQRGNPGGASDCFGTNVPRNDRRGCVIASAAWQSQKNSKIKRQNYRVKLKNVVRGFSLVHDPEGSHYKISMKLKADG
jgi:hypothetical protein